MSSQPSRIASLLERNRQFAGTNARQEVPPIPFVPRQLAYVITCIDPRTDPAAFLGIELGDAIVERTVGGRVTPAVIQDVAYISYLVDAKAPSAPRFEVAVIHHTDCGSALLADHTLRHDFAERTGYDERALASLPVIDPVQSVKADVELILRAPQVSPEITVSGHVYDLQSGLVTTVAPERKPEERIALC